MGLPIALQLWSVKEDVEKDFFGTLEKIAKMGYDGVEFAGYYGKSAAEIKSMLTKLGLKVAGSHISWEQIVSHTDKVIAYEREIGNKFVVCPGADFSSLAEWQHFIEEMQIAREKLAAAGLTLVYHNHAHEFAIFHDEYILDMLLKQFHGELDTYWIEYAGIDAIEYMKMHKGRTPLIHIKDMAPSKQESTEVGNGILDIDGIVKQAIENGAEWLIVEQEAFTKPPLESVEIGLNNVKKIFMTNVMKE